MKEIVDAQYADGPARDQHLKSAEDMRNALIEEMRQEVEPLPR